MITIPSKLIPEFQDALEEFDFTSECIKQLNNLRAEFRDDKFGERLHGSDATYMDGCTGPLCKQAHRLYARKRTGSAPSRYWVHMEPILEYLGSQVQMELDRRLRELRIAVLTEIDIEIKCTKTDNTPADVTERNLPF